jgi:hypothetical protein
MTNIDKLSAAIAEWGTNVAASVLPQVHIPETSTIGRVMQGFFGIDLASYSIYKELGFLLEPTMQTLVKPMLDKYLSAFDDDKVRELAIMYAEAFMKQAQERGSINLFGVELGANAFEGLHEIINKHLK